MQLGNLRVDFHRTVRVADGRTPAALPPSFGITELHPVEMFKEKCPKTWDHKGFFIALHDTEALWLSFDTSSWRPVAILVGAGGINAISGEKLGTKLEKDNYLVAPPQPWLDGWKSPDGCVYQFVATPHQKGEGKSVGEQLIGKESVTGGIGVAVFHPNAKFHMPVPKPVTNYSGLAGPIHVNSLLGSPKVVAGGPEPAYAGTRVMDFSEGAEMGIGKGGKILQKIYADPHGIDIWDTAPVALGSVYLVNAVVFSQITGKVHPRPVGQAGYKGPWYEVKDEHLADNPGSGKFTNLESVPEKPVVSAPDGVFVGDTSNVAKK